MFTCFSGSRVVLKLEEITDALAWMIALDGLAASVLLVPSALKDTEELALLEQRFGADLVINERQISEWRNTMTPVQQREAGPMFWDTDWVLATSGTTGTPTLVSHKGDALVRTAKTDRDRGAEFVWGLVFDAFRFAGLQVVLQALAGGSRLVICDPCEPIHEQASRLRQSGVNALSATPTYWRKLLMTGVLKGQHFRQITLGGEPADQSILDALKAAFPAARIAHIYASTETGIGFSVTDGCLGFPVGYLKSTVAGRSLAIGPSGTLRIKPMSSAQTGVLPLDESGFFDTGDLVEIRGNRVCFVGRSSGVINVGGSKVIPEQVEAVIRSVTGVADALVKARASSVTGQLVVADVVPQSPDTDTAALRKTILARCKTSLEPYKVPALIRFVEQIDANSAGKANRM